jgi:hypothetical protein
MSLTLNNIAIESRAEDNFINATQLCKAGGKKFKDWDRLDSTKELIKELEKSIGVDANCKLIDKKVGGSHSGSWVHPDLAVPLAQWISPAFTIQVSKWIREWRSFSDENEAKYMKELSNLKPSASTQLEKEIQLKLQKELGAAIEVRTPVGYIDLLTDNKIIEIKHISNWKSALGQVLSYGDFYPEKNKELYLFGESACNIDQICRICSKYGVKVELV